MPFPETKVTDQDKDTKDQKVKRNKFFFLFRYNQSDESESKIFLFLLTFWSFVSLVLIGNLKCDLTAEVDAETCADSRRGQAESEEIHQLGDGCLGGHVVARDNPAVGERLARGIAVDMDAAADALGDVDYDHSAVDRALYLLEKPRMCGSVAGSVAPHHDPLYPGGVEDVVERGTCHSRMEVEKDDVAVHSGVDMERTALVGAAQPLLGKLYAQSYPGQFGVVVALEGIEIVGALLGGAVATPQIVLEQDGHLLHHRITVEGGRGGYLQGGDEILLSVGAHLAYRQLWAGDDHRLVKVGQHERESRCRVGHGVGAVEHDESVIALIVVGYGQGDVAPPVGIHVRRVDRRELYVVDMIVKHLHLRHIVHQMCEIEGLESMGLGVLDHSDGASGVDDEYARSVFPVHGVIFKERGLYQPIFDPGATGADGARSTMEPSEFSAESIMPCDTMPLSLRGGRFAMKHTCLPTSSSGL